MDPKIVETITNYLINTPPVLFFLLSSFLSGHLWIFIILTYSKSNTRGNTRIDNAYGKIALGIGWFTIIFLPIYFLKYQSIDFLYSLMINTVFTTVILGIAIQMIIFFVITNFAKEK